MASGGTGDRGEGDILIFTFYTADQGERLTTEQVKCPSCLLPHNQVGHFVRPAATDGAAAGLQCEERICLTASLLLLLHCNDPLGIYLGPGLA